MNMSKIDSKDQNSSIKDIIQQIKNGLKLQELSLDAIDMLNDEERLGYINSIILQPDYQREYRYSISDESLLVESLLMNIPIPPIFLANDRYNGIQVLNVVDGQHRLTAFFRFMENSFQLQDLKILTDLNKKKYSDLHIDIKERLISSSIQQVIFKEFPGRDIELEIFNRYNKGTKPLTPQEIRNAIYGSRTQQFVNKFCTNLYKNNNELSHVYNVTEDRFLKKKIHESIFVILSILEHGIQTTHKKSPEYAESYMKEKALLGDELKNLGKEIEKLESSMGDTTVIKNNYLDLELQSKQNFNFIKSRFNIFNDFILSLHERIDYPFSRELYGISSRNYKFQISIAMILAGITHKFLSEDKSLSELKDNEDVINYLSQSLMDSYLEDKTYNASSTNVVAMQEFISKIDLNEMFDDK